MNPVQITNYAIRRVLEAESFDYDCYSQAEIEAVRILQRVRHYLLVRMIEEI